MARYWRPLKANAAGATNTVRVPLIAAAFNSRVPPVPSLAAFGLPYNGGTASKGTLAVRNRFGELEDPDSTPRPYFPDDRSTSRSKGKGALDLSRIRPLYRPKSGFLTRRRVRAGNGGGRRAGCGGHHGEAGLRVHPDGLRHAHQGRLAGDDGDPRARGSRDLQLDPHHRGDGEQHERGPGEVRVAVTTK
eukprot:1196355-Prorocentrum_minimum.AAC.2